MDDRDRTPNKGALQSSYTSPRFIPVKRNYICVNLNFYHN